MKAKDGVDKEASTAFGCDSLRNCNKMYHLAEPVNEHKNTIILDMFSGNPKPKSIETDSQHSAGTGRDCKGARSEWLGFTR